MTAEDARRVSNRMVDAIVVPLDGSERSERAIPVARAVATRSRARLVLVSAVRRDREDPTERLEKLAADCAGLETSVVVVRDGPAPFAIRRAAVEAGDSAVCMTTHGRGALRWAVLGSVAEEVVRTVERPVLLVGRRCDPEWTAAAGPMLVCLSGSERSNRVVEDAVNWANGVGLQLRGAIVIHPLDVEDGEHSKTLIAEVQSAVAEQGTTFELALPVA